MRRFLDRLFPARLRQKHELSGEERRALFAQVTDGDPGLRAVHDLLGDALEGNAAIAFNPDEPEAKRLLACNRAGICCDLMRTIELERKQAQEWVKGQQR